MTVAKTVFFVLPTQLFDCEKVYKPHALKNTTFYVIEEPIFFYDHKYKPFYCNRVKCAFLRAAMKCFYDDLSRVMGKKKVRYIEYVDVDDFYKNFHDGDRESKNKILMYDPCDFDLMKKYRELGFGVDMTVMESPNFLHYTNTLKEYVSSCKNRPKHASFYEFSKKRLGSLVSVLDGVKNMDKENRLRPPTEDFMKKIVLLDYACPKKLKIYYKEAIEYVSKNFDEKYRVGTMENCEHYPITSSESYDHFADFLRQRFLYFGKYQDAIMQQHTYMFHSVISPMLNCGLMDPKVIIQMIVDFWDENKKIVPLSSLEGLLRQIIGWREYERMLYVFWCEDILSSNLPKNDKKIKDWKAWYEGNTGILPLDSEIKKAVGCGYSHHIVRLMVFMNFMILCGLHPYEIYKWFMEVVSMDAYSWVMVSNIWTMGYFWKNAMTKPYLSSSNYVLKMSDYKKNGQWEVLWNGLYRNFVASKPIEYVFFYKRTIKRQDDVAQTEEKKLVENFLNKITKS